MAAPSMPTNLAAKAVSSSQIDLTWGASTGNIDRYQIMSGNGSSRQFTVKAPATSFSDTGLKPSARYTYHINAVDTSGKQSAWTPWVNATTLAADVPPQPEPTPPPSQGTVDFEGLFLGASMQGLSLGALQPAGTNNAWQKLQGNDTKYAMTLPRAPASVWGGSASQTDQFQVIGATGDTVNSIETDTSVPAGVSSQVLTIKMVNAYNGSVFTQSQYLEFPSSSAAQSMVYTSRWCWLQGDLATRGNFSFLMLSECKTPGNTTERFQAQLVMQNWTGFPGKPVLMITHDLTTSPNFEMYCQTFCSPTGVNPDPSYGIGQTYMAPIPLGRWFRLEFAYNRADPSGQGWVWAGLTDPASTDGALKAGREVFSKRGAFTRTDGATGKQQTMGLNAVQTGAKIDRMFMACGYSDVKRSASSPFTIKYTDIQVYTRWPSTASAHPASYV